MPAFDNLDDAQRYARRIQGARIEDRTTHWFVHDGTSNDIHAKIAAIKRDDSELVGKSYVRSFNTEEEANSCRDEIVRRGFLDAEVEDRGTHFLVHPGEKHVPLPLWMTLILAILMVTMMIYCAGAK